MFGQKGFKWQCVILVLHTLSTHIKLLKKARERKKNNMNFLYNLFDKLENFFSIYKNTKWIILLSFIFYVLSVVGVGYLVSETIKENSLIFFVFYCVIFIHTISLIYFNSFILDFNLLKDKNKNLELKLLSFELENSKLHRINSNTDKSRQDTEQRKKMVKAARAKLASVLRGYTCGFCGEKENQSYYECIEEDGVRMVGKVFTCKKCNKTTILKGGE